MFKTQTTGRDKAGRRVVVGFWDEQEVVPSRHGKWAVFAERSNYRTGIRYVLINACTQSGTDEQTARAIFTQTINRKR